MSGTSRPDEIERATGLELPDGEYDTVAGLVLDRLERLAEVGDSVVVDGVLIEVTEVDGYAIEEVRLQVASRRRGRRAERDDDRRRRAGRATTRGRHDVRAPRR